MMEARFEGTLGGRAGTSKAARGRRTPYWLCGTGRIRARAYFVRAVMALGAAVVCGSMATAAPRAAGVPQDSKDACAPVHAAGQKTAKESNSSNAANAGAINVPDAIDKISSEAGHKETCKYLRDETLNGEPANVYSDVFTSKSGTTTGTVWISKKNLWTLKQEVDVDLGAAGKGHQTMVFEYPKK
jgi:hypothetical protein